MKGTFQLITWKIDHFCFTPLEISHHYFGEGPHTIDFIVRTGKRVIRFELNIAPSSKQYNEDHFSIEKEMV